MKVNSVLCKVVGVVLYLNRLFLLTILITTFLSVVDETSIGLKSALDFCRDSVEYSLDVEVDNDSVELGIGE